jgi:polyphosphate kinase 2
MADQLPDAEAIRAKLEKLAVELGLKVTAKRAGGATLTWADGTRIEAWREDYPYPDRLGGKRYQSAKRSLQVELAKLQRSVKISGQRLLIIFEGRDAAGKGGAIRRFTENLNPRGARVVALEQPGAHEQGDNYLRRYLPHLPAPGEIALFDRSWYNRAGVEQVLGFCHPDEYARFLDEVPAFERGLVADGITVIKFWFSITRAEQLRRFVDRMADPVKRWKISQVDLASLDRWHEYTQAKEAMFACTDIPEAPWTIVKANDKKRARLESMRHVLSRSSYEGKRPELIGTPDPLIIGPVSALLESAQPDVHVADGEQPMARALLSRITQPLPSTADDAAAVG